MGRLVGPFEIGKNLEKVIIEMCVDEEGWTEPESIEIDYLLNIYFDIEGPISKEYDPLNKRNVYVKRIGLEKDDFLVDISKAKDYSWRRLSSREIEDFVEEFGEDRIVKLNYNQEDISLEKAMLREKIKRAVENEEYEKIKKLKDKLKRSK